MTKEQKRALENLKDSELIQKIIKGDTSAFTQLFNLYYRKLYVYSNSFVHNHDKAEEITQQVFIKFNNLLTSGKYNGQRSFAAWTRSVAHNFIIDLFRKPKPEIRLEMLTCEIKAEFSETGFTDENIAVLLQAINDLPDGDKEIIRLRYWEKLEWNDIGKLLNKPAKSLSKQHTRIIEKLKKMMKKKYF